MGKRFLWGLGAILAIGAVGLGLFFFQGGRLEKSDLGQDGGFQIAMVFSGSKGDSALWLAAEEAAEGLKGDLDAFLTLREKVGAEGLLENAEALAARGAALILLDGTVEEAGIQALAKEHPETDFLLLGASLENGSNLASVYGDVRGAGYLLGVLAAYQTRNDVVGAVAAGEDLQSKGMLLGFQYGVASVDPNVQFHGDFASRLGEDGAVGNLAVSFISYGADIILSACGQEDREVFDVLENSGVYGLASDPAFFASHPGTALAAVHGDYLTVIADQVRAAAAGSFEGKAVAVPMALEFNEALKARISARTLERVLGVEEQIRKGELDMEVAVPWQ